MINATTTTDPATMGAPDIVDFLGGDIRPGSLVIIEGEAGSGKSVLSHHVAHNAAESGGCVAYYSIGEKGATDGVRQMDYLNRQVREHRATDHLRLYSLQPETFARPQKALAGLTAHIARLPRRFGLVIIDSLTALVLRENPRSKVDAFNAFKETAETGRSIMLVTHTHLFEEDTLNRVFLMSHCYIRLRTPDPVICEGVVDARTIKTMEVCKLRGAERNDGDVIEFEIKPESGIQILPFVKVKI